MHYIRRTRLRHTCDMHCAWIKWQLHSSSSCGSIRIISHIVCAGYWQSEWSLELWDTSPVCSLAFHEQHQQHECIFRIRILSCEWFLIFLIFYLLFFVSFFRTACDAFHSHHRCLTFLKIDIVCTASSSSQPCRSGRSERKRLFSRPFSEVGLVCLF